MIQIKSLNCYNSDEIYSFFLQTKYRKFNLWPNVSNENIGKFLFEGMKKLNDGENIFIASIDDQIISLLAFNNLDWDTEHFGFKCVRIEYLLINNLLERTLIEKALDLILLNFRKCCEKYDIKFVSISIDSWDIISNVTLQKNNFRYLLTWIDCIHYKNKAFPEIKDKSEFGLIKSDEVNHFEKISSSNYFEGGRFYLDKKFDMKLVKKMYANLIKSSFQNNEIMLVYRIKEKPIGLLISKNIEVFEYFSNLKVAPLRFIITDPELRGKKIAYNLFIKSIEYFKDKCDLIKGGLEIHNFPSLNLHSKVGFKFNYTHNVYHWWSE